MLAHEICAGSRAIDKKLHPDFEQKVRALCVPFGTFFSIHSLKPIDLAANESLQSIDCFMMMLHVVDVIAGGGSSITSAVC